MSYGFAVHTKLLTSVSTTQSVLGNALEIKRYRGDMM